MLLQGRETWYDENDILREWDTEADAVAWCRSELGVDPDGVGETDIPG
jgi:hypothetical protein